MSERPQYPTIHITEIHKNEDGLIVESALTSPVCDFCGHISPRWDYDCETFNVGRHGSVDGWLACEECSRMIESDDREGLVDRSMLAFPDRPDTVASRMRDGLRRMQEGFFNHRIGDRQPFG